MPIEWESSQFINSFSCSFCLYLPPSALLYARPSGEHSGWGVFFVFSLPELEIKLLQILAMSQELLWKIEKPRLLLYSSCDPKPEDSDAWTRFIWCLLILWTVDGGYQRRLLLGIGWNSCIRSPNTIWTSSWHGCWVLVNTELLQPRLRNNVV